MRDVTSGWSAKRKILGQPVFNDKNERIGSIDDIIVAPDKAPEVSRSSRAACTSRWRFG
jgi:hypothetical protein